jgi:hypothetical protein
MTALFALFLLLAAPAPSSLDQVKAELNPERRARAAIDYATAAERNAEAAYAKGDTEGVAKELKNVEESYTTAQESFVASRKTPGRNPGPYKYAEMRTRELLIRLGDLEHRMDPDERESVARVKARTQEIHDAWLEGILGRKK